MAVLVEYVGCVRDGGGRRERDGEEEREGEGRAKEREEEGRERGKNKEVRGKTQAVIFTHLHKHHNNVINPCTTILSLIHTQ